MKISLLLLSLIFSAGVFGQNSCTVKIMTPEGNPTDAAFFIILKADTIYAEKGVLKINTRKYKKLMNEPVVISFTKQDVFQKLYKPFTPSIQKQSLVSLCGKIYVLQHR